jgi:ribosomal-protein-alanine N-acetyltransferase
MQPHDGAGDAVPSAAPNDSWRKRLPVLRCHGAVLRALTEDDAASLLRHVSAGSAAQFVAPPPDSVDAFRRFIGWADRQRQLGNSISYGMAPSPGDPAVGIIQIWPIEPDYSTAEWGFVLGEAYWGSRLFRRSADLALDFAFRVLNVHRLEARSVVLNERANRALERLGARREGVLRAGFHRGDLRLDQIMWSMLAAEWSPAAGRPTALPELVP